jgi:hypothetical protein
MFNVVLINSVRNGSLNSYEHQVDTVTLTEWNLSQKVQGELCEDHLYQKEQWETPTWTRGFGRNRI